MEQIIDNCIHAYIRGLMTREELATIIAKEYAKLWARGQILAQLTKQGQARLDTQRRTKMKNYKI